MGVISYCWPYFPASASSLPISMQLITYKTTPFPPPAIRPHLLPICNCFLKPLSCAKGWRGRCQPWGSNPFNFSPLCTTLCTLCIPLLCTTLCISLLCNMIHCAQQCSSCIAAWHTEHLCTEMIYLMHLGTKMMQNKQQGNTSSPKRPLNLWNSFDRFVENIPTQNKIWLKPIAGKTFYNVLSASVGSR